MYNLPDTLIKANLIKRINRFVAEVLINSKPETVYVPNTGRLFLARKFSSHL
jgi:DNA-binding sugar fermentation-stimulating protein